ncbi:hypothetical protein VTG60DRAFT_2016 [Thermothelomyces hinnuleus]
MSATSSSPTTSPVQPHFPRPQHNCLECKRLKRACDKKLPCGKCEKAGRNCEYRDPGDDGVFGPISAARDIHSLAFGTLLDILVNKQGIKEAISSYFDGVNTWFTVVERAAFERELEANWGNLQAETSAMALSMALIARPPNQKSSKGMGDTVYLSTKAILSLVQSKVPISTKMLQAELLVAMYEFSHSMPQQAYLSLGRCLQMTKAMGWHDPTFWALEKQISRPADLKLCSILWWAIVYVDCLLNVAYQDPATQAYPMNTMGLNLGFPIPSPDALDQFFPGSPFQIGGQNEGFRDANSDQMARVVFPEAVSAWYLFQVLQHLSNPAVQDTDSRRELSNHIFRHMKATGRPRWRACDRAIGTDLIALMKLHQPHLAGMPDPLTMMIDPSHAEDTTRMRTVIDVIHGKAGKVTQIEELDRGAVDPSWAFAMCYASQLLISYGYNTLQDLNWLQKVADLRAALERVSRRWKIAEQYCRQVTIDLDNRLAAGFVN